MTIADKHQGIINALWYKNKENQMKWMQIQDQWINEGASDKWQKYHNDIVKNLIPGTENFGEFKATTQSPIAGIIFDIEGKLLLYTIKVKGNNTIASGQHITHIADYMIPTYKS
jgi:hypothetical protein